MCLKARNVYPRGNPCPIQFLSLWLCIPNCTYKYVYIILRSAIYIKYIIKSVSSILRKTYINMRKRCSENRYRANEKMYNHAKSSDH